MKALPCKSLCSWRRMETKKIWKRKHIIWLQNVFLQKSLEKLFFVPAGKEKANFAHEVGNKENSIGPRRKEKRKCLL